MVQGGINYKGNKHFIGDDRGLDCFRAAFQAYGENVNREFQEIRSILSNISLRLGGNGEASTINLGKTQHQNHPMQRQYYGKIVLPTFNGYLDMEAFLDWCYEVDNYIDTLGVPEDKRAKYIACKLKGRTSVWWDTVQNNRRMQGKHSVQNWKKMMKLMMKQFLPPDYQQHIKQPQPLSPTHEVMTSWALRSKPGSKLSEPTRIIHTPYTKPKSDSSVKNLPPVGMSAQLEKFVNLVEENEGDMGEENYKDKTTKEESESLHCMEQRLIIISEKKDSSQQNEILSSFFQVSDQVLKLITDFENCSNMGLKSPKAFKMLVNLLLKRSIGKFRGRVFSKRGMMVDKIVLHSMIKEILQRNSRSSFSQSRGV